MFVLLIEFVLTANYTSQGLLGRDDYYGDHNNKHVVKHNHDMQDAWLVWL